MATNETTKSTTATAKPKLSRNAPATPRTPRAGKVEASVNAAAAATAKVTKGKTEGMRTVGITPPMCGRNDRSLLETEGIAQWYAYCIAGSTKSAEGNDLDTMRLRMLAAGAPLWHRKYAASDFSWWCDRDPSSGSARKGRMLRTDKGWTYVGYAPPAYDGNSKATLKAAQTVFDAYVVRLRSLGFSTAQIAETPSVVDFVRLGIVVK